MEIVRSTVLACICGRTDSHPSFSSYGEAYSDTKAVPQSEKYQIGPSMTSQAAKETLFALQMAEKDGFELSTCISDIVARAGGWTKRIARAILDSLESALRAGSPMGDAMRDAYARASDAAAGLLCFAHDHPILCTVIALGLLVILAPAVIHALGFGVQGPVGGSFAAGWQSTYGGFVEAGSLFSYLQKLGMLY